MAGSVSDAVPHERVEEDVEEPTVVIVEVSEPGIVVDSEVDTADETDVT